MPYVICEKCGGYYELEKGESPEDFDTCQCGGNLKYAEKINQKREENEGPKLICSNCLRENEDGIYCSKCGGRLITIKNGKAVSNIKRFNESKQIKRPSRASKNVKNDYYDPEEPKDLFERINWLGILAGAGFFIISMIIVVLILFFSFAGKYSYGYSYDYSGFIFAFIIAIILGLILAVISGGLAAYASKTRDYVDGLINGFLVGFISSIILGLIGGILVIVMGIIIYGALAAVGGAIGIFLRRELDKRQF